ncbi:MAG: SDR family oxidoreductase [Candidatus Hydrogenedentes bacterium]|nr:SDR family oxidoreductase [Candidatus Hydrogenedentota bacterium]
MTQSFFITGSASGIGRHLTDVLLKQGNQVCATDLNHEALRQAASELGWPQDRVHLLGLDVTRYDEWLMVFGQAVEAMGGVDVTMNIAGLLLASWAEESPQREIDLQVDVNIKGVIYGTRVSAEHMVQRHHGHIINIASIAGLVPVPGLSVYCASKYAVRGYSLAAAMELRPKGVYVTAICPSTVQTPMLDNQVNNDAAQMFFSGHSILTVKDIEDAVLVRALRHKPYEVHVPRLKTWIARTVDIFPPVGPFMAPLYQRSGRKRQEMRRREGV